MHQALGSNSLVKSKVQQGPFLETMFMIRSMIMSLLENCMAYGISLSLSLSHVCNGSLMPRELFCIM
jgi:hypothetical protein